MSIAPPVVKDNWSYAGDFYVEASGHNRHRRATLPELRAHFDGSGGTRDHPAHWYEAQLLHYGLPPSKTKGTAKMRLFEAVTTSNPAVPAHISKIESELKKEWTKREREAKQVLKKQADAAAHTSKASGKRKADQAYISSATNVNINLNLSVNTQGQLLIAPEEPARKKAKATASTPKTPKVQATKTKISAGKTATAPKGKTSATKSAASPKTTKASKTSASPASKAKAPRKQTARRGTSRGGSRTLSSRVPPVEPSSSLPCPKQTARPSQPFHRSSQERPAPVYDEFAPWGNSDDEPPPYHSSPSEDQALYISDGEGYGQFW